MTLYSNMQICGVGEITVYRRDETVWVTIKDGNQRLTMEADHAFALGNAAAAFLDDEGKEAVDAAEPARVTA